MTTAVAGGKRAHLLPTPIWVLVLRILQALVSVIVMALCAWGVSTITTILPFSTIRGNDAYGFAFFAFSWTFLYLLWLALSLTAVPVAYHIWAHLPLECLTVLFWLVAFALLARNSGDYSAADDGSDLAGTPIRNFLDATYAAAGLSALVWLLFIATLVHLSMCVHKHLKTKSASKTTANPTTANAGAAPVMQTVAPNQQGVAPAGVPPAEAPGHNNNNNNNMPPQQQQQQYPPQGQNQAYPPQGSHPHGFNNNNIPPQQGYYPPQQQQQQQQNNGTGVDYMVSDPSLYGTYQQHGAPQTVSPQTTGPAFAPSPTSSPPPVMGQGQGQQSHSQSTSHGQGQNQAYHDPHAGAHELSTFKGDPALVELPSGAN